MVKPSLQEQDEDEEADEFAELAVGSLLSNAAAAHVVRRKMKPVIRRSKSIKSLRMNWISFKAMYDCRVDYTRHLRMPPEDFDNLLLLLRPALQLVDERQSLRRGLSPIIPEIKLYCCLRWLAGGSHSDIALYANLSYASFYRVVWEVIDAINATKDLAMAFPQSPTECFRCANNFKQISYKEAIVNCVSVVDGYNPEIVAPPKARVGNVKAYFSGHKQKDCVNVQAAVDAFCRFQFLAVAGPGNLPDREAIKRCGLDALISKLPGDYVAIMDCAYTAKAHACPLYYGANKFNPLYDNFNFFGSQLRIRSEMAFGLLYQKWGILWRPLRIDICHVKCVIQALGRLHNYCIDRRLLREGRVSTDQYITRSSRELPDALERQIQQREESFENSMMENRCDCHQREIMASRVQRLGLTRPSG